MKKENFMNKIKDIFRNLEEKRQTVGAEAKGKVDAVTQKAQRRRRTICC